MQEREPCSKRGNPWEPSATVARARGGLKHREAFGQIMK